MTHYRLSNVHTISCEDIGLGHLSEPVPVLWDSQALPRSRSDIEQHFSKPLLYAVSLSKAGPSEKYGLTWKFETIAIVPNNILAEVARTIGKAVEHVIKITKVQPGHAAARYNWMMASFGEASLCYFKQIKVNDIICCANGATHWRDLEVEMQTNHELSLLIWRPGAPQSITCAEDVCTLQAQINAVSVPVIPNWHQDSACCAADTVEAAENTPDVT